MRIPQRRGRPTGVGVIEIEWLGWGLLLCRVDLCRGDQHQVGGRARVALVALAEVLAEVGELEHALNLLTEVGDLSNRWWLRSKDGEPRPRGQPRVMRSWCVLTEWPRSFRHWWCGGGA
jgi:hypothetical protein